MEFENRTLSAGRNHLLQSNNRCTLPPRSERASEHAWQRTCSRDHNKWQINDAMTCAALFSGRTFHSTTHSSAPAGKVAAMVAVAALPKVVAPRSWSWPPRARLCLKFQRLCNDAKGLAPTSQRAQLTLLCDGHCHVRRL
uniref:Uncharacterized protein n=1 Tax=Haptolina brevifila TaxID=156173 RepID=A0A7S2GB04_9EUKA